jgi:hypothetical protein
MLMEVILGCLKSGPTCKRGRARAAKWVSHLRPMSPQSARNVGRLKRMMEIWISCELISKFRDLDVNFRSVGYLNDT